MPSSRLRQWRSSPKTGARNEDLGRAHCNRRPSRSLSRDNTPHDWQEENQREDRGSAVRRGTCKASPRNGRAQNDGLGYDYGSSCRSDLSSKDSTLRRFRRRSPEEGRSTNRVTALRKRRKLRELQELRVPQPIRGPRKTGYRKKTWFSKKRLRDRYVWTSEIRSTNVRCSYHTIIMSDLIPSCKINRNFRIFAHTWHAIGVFGDF